MDLKKGDVLTIHVGGGGGYGDPAGRSRSAIERDIDDGLVSAEAAHRDYPAIAAE